MTDIDRDRLNSLLDDLKALQDEAPIPPFPSIIKLFDMLLAGQLLWYCQVHMETSWSNEHCWAAVRDPGPCRMVKWWTFPIPTGDSE